MNKSKEITLSPEIRAKIIQNTKHLTHNIEHKTFNNLLISNEMKQLISDEMRDLVSPLGSSGQPVLATASGEVNCGLVNEQIEYLAISVKTPNPEKPERLDVNVDFTTGGQFNKLTFDLVHYNRKREFMANIHDKEYAGWPGYAQAQAELTKAGFIGKGRPRGAYTANRARKRSPIVPETAMTLDGDTMICHLWIEDAYIILQLNDWSDKCQLFCAKGEYIKQGTMKSWKRGGWL